MKRISTLFEIIVSAALLFLGLYMLYEGSSNESTNEAAVLIRQIPRLAPSNAAALNA
jgi:hypothetical protein